MHVIFTDIATIVRIENMEYCSQPLVSQKEFNINRCSQKFAEIYCAVVTVVNFCDYAFYLLWT